MCGDPQNNNLGRAAIKATLWSEETEYYFFVAKGDRHTNIFKTIYQASGECGEVPPIEDFALVSSLPFSSN